ALHLFAHLPSSLSHTDTINTPTLSLHDALPICGAVINTNSVKHASHDPQPSSTQDQAHEKPEHGGSQPRHAYMDHGFTNSRTERSEEHTSELQSHLNLVCRLLLEKKKESATNLC